ncbi:MAG: cell division protein FtsA [Candidatus Pacebacteria bacterium RIFCSPHIGHO2_01_FULL_46_10]|nr:MAG: cell division protein FtsA [Candidatus Pacebacteria bacterium RIFCSPHIGHO2_01_FULL_46_10]
MPKHKTIAAIDIGTEKICTLISVLHEGTREPQVVGVASVPSRGLRKSQIVDLDEAISAMTESVDAAERMAGTGIKSAFVSVGGAHIQSQNSKGVVAASNPQGEITEEDVRRVIEAARAVSLPNAREVIHVIPRDYQVDSQSGIKDPIGMSGVRLEAEAHIITGSSTAMRNITKCLSELGIQCSGFVFSGLAAAHAVLSETERELGVVVVDIGAGSTSICAFVEGSLAYSGVLPIGARHITSDIALGLRMSLQSAEKVKLSLARVYTQSTEPLPGETREQARERKKKHDELDPHAVGVTEEVGMLSKKTLVEGIIVPRLQEMFKLIGEELEKQNLYPLIPAGIVLTGGGAETVQIVEVCKRMLNLPTRIGEPYGLTGLTDEIYSPMYSATSGLLVYGVKMGAEESTQKGQDLTVFFKHLRVKQLIEKSVKFIRSLFP